MITKLKYQFDYNRIVKDYDIISHKLVTYESGTRADCLYDLDKLVVYKEDTLDPIIKGTVYEEIINDIKVDYNVAQAMFRGTHANQCYTWHNDSYNSIHVPITNTDVCFYIFRDNFYTMDADGSCYYFDASKHHTACNASLDIRINFFIWVEQIIPQ